MSLKNLMWFCELFCINYMIWYDLIIIKLTEYKN